MGHSLLVIVPTFSHFDYAKAACESLVATTPGAVPLVVDDASKEWGKPPLPGWPAEAVYHHFAKNGGLTRSWNFGLRYARDHGFEYATCANSDVLFTPGWFDAVARALALGVDLAGPLTNAPGHQPKQQVSRHLPDFKLSDDPAYLAQVADRLARKNGEAFTPLRVNGFCMTARTETWWKGAHDTQSVFDPKFKMTKNEDELQGRWKRLGLVSALVPASFVFHYRGVTRRGGNRGREGQGWHRRKTQ